MIEILEADDEHGAEVQLSSCVKLPRSCEIDFGPHLVGTGWHSFERAESTSYRWMGALESAAVILAVDRSAELEIAIRIWMVIDEACWSSFGFELDGESIGADVSRDAKTCRLIVPASTTAAHMTELRICNKVSRIPLPDTRRLSVAICQVLVRPTRDVLTEPLRLDFRAKMASYFEQMGDAAPFARRQRRI